MSRGCVALWMVRGIGIVKMVPVAGNHDRQPDVQGWDAEHNAVPEQNNEPGEQISHT